MIDELENRFKFHPAETQEARDKHQHIRKTLRDATEEVVNVIPEGNREASLFTTHMDLAMMYANAAVARHSRVVVQPSTAKPSRVKK